MKSKKVQKGNTIINRQLLGENIKNERISLGYTQMELADRITDLSGSIMDVSTISDWEHGFTVPSLENFACLCTIFRWDSTTTLLDPSFRVKITPKGDTFKQRLFCLLTRSSINKLPMLAEELGVSMYRLTKWRTSGIVPEEYKDKLLTLLQCTEEELFGA